MSDVNSTLPDDDALAAFANDALGGGRRRRRRKDGEGEPAEATSDTSPTPAEDAPAPEPAPAVVEEAPVAAQAAPDPEPAPAPAQQPVHTVAVEHHDEAAQTTEPTTPAEEQRAAVPNQTASPDHRGDTAAAAGEAERNPSARDVEVRAVSVPMTRDVLPPGLTEDGVIEVRVPNLGIAGTDATQCTIMISSAVRDRFARYQLEKKMAGDAEPSNALVVRRAFLHARRNNLFLEILKERYHQANAVDVEDYDEDGLLGAVVGRRAVRGRVRDSGQQSFRPSKQELATYDAFQTAYGFADRSSFLEGVLDRFLPQLPASGRRR
ncbi:hypothetical protein AB0958_19115 [Streptomyces sp. NPDC006655]|uniref:hypothetical protein n=1 Tax=Streptomyces sp. NPDC006655 TaxID=3156898 RepID=UPI0034561F84